MSKVFNMVGSGGGLTASIYVTGLSETDTVTATNGSKTKTGMWTQKPNPAYVTLPDGYTQLEYIKSTGTQYIDTNWVHKANSKIVVSCNVSDSTRDGWLGIFGSGNPDYKANAWMFFSRFGNNNVPAISRTGNEKTGSNFFYNKDITITAEGNTVSWSGKSGEQSLTASGTVDNGAVSMYLLALHEGNKANRFSVAKLYSAQFFTGTVLERDFIPAKRNSDSAVGLYDIVNGKFYANAGTGTFTAGPEVPQTVGGFLISKIKDFGTWTVTATDGTRTATQTVLIDIAGLYEVEIYLDWEFLFNYGRQSYAWQPRAWKLIDNDAHVAVLPTVTNNDDGSVTVTFNPGGYNLVAGVYEMVEDFDLTDFNTLVLNYDFSATGFSTRMISTQLVVVNRNSIGWESGEVAVSRSNIIGNDLIIELDVSTITGAYDIVVGWYMNLSTRGTTGIAKTTIREIIAK